MLQRPLVKVTTSSLPAMIILGTRKGSQTGEKTCPPSDTGQENWPDI